MRYDIGVPLICRVPYIGPCLMTKILRGQCLEQLSRTRALDIQLGHARGHICDDDVRIMGCVSLHPWIKTDGDLPYSILL